VAESTPENRTPGWYERRRQGITSTDIPPILGVDRYRSEGDVARDKMGQESEPEPTTEPRRFRLGRALEDVVKVEDELEHGIKLRRVRRLVISRTIPWAMTSLDFERIGERTIVEVKTSTSREWDDGLPDRVEAQVRWQMGVAGYPRAHIAALRYGRDLVCHDITHDEAAFINLVRIVEDFRRRLATGGPFEESRASIRRAFPYDDGSEMTADAALTQAVRDLLVTRRNIEQAKTNEDILVSAIQSKMGPASVLFGPGFRVTWRRGSERRHTEWKLVAEGLRTRVTDDEWDAIVDIQTTLRPGSRPFIIRETDS
jgi:putative phage-type endonuclease